MPKLLTAKRKKMNFMVNEDIIMRLESLIPSGGRSDFVNEAMEEALAAYGRKKAFEFIETFKKSQKKSWTSEKIVSFIKNEREKRTRKLEK